MAVRTKKGADLFPQGKICPKKGVRHTPFGVCRDMERMGSANVGQGIGAADDSDHDTADDAADIGVLGVLVDDAGNDGGAGQDDQHGEQPHAVHVVVGPHQVRAGEVGDVLQEQQDDGGHSGGQSQDGDVHPLLADGVVVEAVDSHGVGHVVDQEQESVGSEGDAHLVDLEGTDSQDPDTEVSR